MTPEQFTRLVLETLADHQNVGSNHRVCPFLDKDQAFDAIATLALEHGLLVENKDDGLLTSVFADESAITS